ncbi:hypothetical protein PR048_021832 [Dryococelus australis]|uniref:Uncharacterized protein n=1 Tax=Dryococelus australis TaxID=614101 RepID=A0ABQ9GZB0_9NEOP|nr:hypothetical protein PR048_021832 [Dryococelus australis]
MELFKPPSPLILDGNLGENLRKFKQHSKVFMLAMGFVSKQFQVKVAMLLNVIGDGAVELQARLQKSVEGFLADYCDPVKNIAVERFKFYSRLLDECESFESFLIYLEKLMKSCEFKDQTDSVVRDRIYLGIRDKGLQECMLREPDLTLIKAIEQGLVTELERQ